jgi:PAS domain S-box-containing protein
MFSQRLEKREGQAYNLALVRDMAERKHAGERIRQQEAELRRVLDFTPQLIGVFGPDRKRIYANRCTLEYLGLTLEEWQGISDPLWFFHPDDRERVANHGYSEGASDVPHEFEARFRKKDGTHRWFLFRENPLRDEQGRLTRWYVAAIDIEDRKRAEEALQRSQQLLKRHQTEITALNERLMKAQEEERTRIAGELHDGVLQQLTSVTLMLGAVKCEIPQDSEAIQEIQKLQKQLMQVGTDIRQLSHELHPEVLKGAGLPEALAGYCEEFSKTRGIPVTCDTDATAKELSRGAALVLYRIAQEALGNVAKHAEAKHVQVRLTRSNGRVRLSVSDDGIGFSPEGAGKAGGLGLVNMRERVRQLNGTLELQSEPGCGTTVTAEVPFRPVP